MGTVAETTPAEEKDSFSWSAFILWPVAVFVIYFLSAGPLVMMADKKVLSDKTMRRVETIYRPIEWVYEETALRKPIGMYLHLWSKRFDQTGNEK